MSDKKVLYILIFIALTAGIAYGWIDQGDIDRLFDIAEGAFK